MKKAVVAIALAILFVHGCGSENDGPANDHRAQYQPSDGRNLGPGLAPYSHGDPQFPADVDRGGGGGPR